MDGLPHQLPWALPVLSVGYFLANANPVLSWASTISLPLGRWGSQGSEFGKVCPRAQSYSEQCAYTVWPCNSALLGWKYKQKIQTSSGDLSSLSPICRHTQLLLWYRVVQQIGVTDVVDVNKVLIGNLPHALSLWLGGWCLEPSHVILCSCFSFQWDSAWSPYHTAVSRDIIIGQALWCCFCSRTVRIHNAASSKAWQGVRFLPWGD